MLLGERSVNQMRSSSEYARIFKNNAVHTSELSPAQLLHLVERGEYVMHQWLCFPGARRTAVPFIAAKSLQEGFIFFVPPRRNSPLPPARF